MDPSTATTTLHVHRCRFVDYTPSAVTALAFPPLPLPSSPKGKERETDASSSTSLNAVGTLAVGHANGNIDLCEWTATGLEKQASQAWVVRKTLAGLYPSKVDALTFIIKHPHKLSEDEVPSLSNLRLFSSGGGSELLEWDLEKGCIKRTISSQGGCIWSLAANAAGTRLALGCEDGWIRILDVSDDGLHHSRRLDRVKGRILSIAWGPPSPPEKKQPQEADSDSDDEEEWTDTFLVTGGSDSSLRKWDYASGRVVERMSTDRVRGERTLVWTVGILGDGTIVSGDSMGSVKFWDSRTATQLQTFKGHNADVLCMTFGPDGSTVYTSGVDQKVCQYSLVRLQKTEVERTFTTKQWAQTSSRRLHSHDVRALALWPPYSNLPSSHRRTFSSDVAPILASAGLDMSVVLTPAASPLSSLAKTINPLRTSVEANFADAYHRRLAYTNCRNVSIAKDAGLLASMGDAHVSIWRVKRLGPERLEDSEEFTRSEDKGGWNKVVEMDLHVQTNLTTCELSHNGKWLVIGDWYETKLFALDAEADGGISPRRIRNFTDILKSNLEGFSSTGTVSAAFSPDCSKLVLSTAMSSFVLILDLSDPASGPKVLRRFDHHRKSRLSGRETKLAPATFQDDEDVEMASVVEEAEDVKSDVPTSVYVSHMAISSDGQWLATSDERSRTHIYNLDSIQHHCVLPSFPLPCQTLTFDPARPSLLILAFPNNTLQIYDVESRQFPSWSRSLSANLPKRLTQAHDPIVGISVDPAVSSSSSTSPYLLLWGTTWLCKIRLDDTTLFPKNASKRKRRRESMPVPTATADKTEEDQNSDFKMVTHYRPILLADFVGEGELVVVERPLVDVLATLPPAFFKHKYGSS